MIVLPALLLSACAAQPRQWDKPGADREMARQDLRDCRKASSYESRRLLLDNTASRLTLPTGAYSPAGRVDPYSLRRDSSDRFANEARLTAFCMRNKGYEFNPTPTDIRPTSPLR